MAEWLEYMTAEGNSTLAQLRRKNGRDKPFRVHYFAVGNETWGCGGNMRPSSTPTCSARRHLPEGPRVQPPHHHRQRRHRHADRVDRCAQQERVAGVNAISHHEYTLPSGSGKARRARPSASLRAEWVSTLGKAQQIDQMIVKNIEVLDKNDPAKKIGFYFDEVGQLV